MVTFLSDPVNMEYIKINGESQAPQQMLLSLVTLIQLFFFFWFIEAPEGRSVF